MTLRERAAALLRAVADGEALPREEVRALAREWLEVTGGNTALAVLTGGELEVARIVELCGRVLQAFADTAMHTEEQGGREV